MKTFEEYRFTIRHSDIKNNTHKNFEDLWNGGGVLFSLWYTYGILIVQVCDSNATKDKILRDFSALSGANFNSYKYETNERFFTTSFKEIENKIDLIQDIRYYKTLWSSQYKYEELNINDFKKEHPEIIEENM